MTHRFVMTGGAWLCALASLLPASQAAAATSLETHLAACPSGLSVRGDVSCMVGLLEGRTLDGAQRCGFRWTSFHRATYAVGSRSVLVGDGTYISNVFEKAAAAGSSSGFSIGWSLSDVGSAARSLTLSYQRADEPRSAAGLLIVPAVASGLPSCLVTQGPGGSAASSTENLLGRHWRAPTRVNGSSGHVSTLPDRAAFDAGLADDGQAVLAFRQADATGRIALQVVRGTPGGAGQPQAWSAPQVLDATAPLLTGAWPRVAVSANGHAVVMWPSQEPCAADGYQGTQTGLSCHVVYASRRLATDSDWEAPVRVAAAPLAIPDYSARINSRGDVVLSFSGAQEDVGSEYDPLWENMPMMARREVDEASYRTERLTWLWTSPQDTTLPDYLKISLGEGGELTLASKTNATMADKVMRRAFDLDAPWVPSDSLKDTAYAVYDLAQGAGGFAAYTDKPSTGVPTPLNPPRLNLYSPVAARWSAFDISAYTVWGDTQLLGTAAADGEFLLYAGCKLTRWRANTWGATQSLPRGCGRDQAGGRYAFNRKGDYVGIDWAGRAGQWGYYRRSGNQLLKGAPGSTEAVSDDFVLGRATDVQGLGSTQLLLANNGVALLVSSNRFTRMPTATSAGSRGGAADKLWAVYLR